MPDIREVARTIASKSALLYLREPASLWLLRRNAAGAVTASDEMWKDLLAWQWYWCRDGAPLHDAALLCRVGVAGADGRAREAAEEAVRRSERYPQVVARWRQVEVVLFAVRCSVARLAPLGPIELSSGRRCAAYDPVETGESATALVAGAVPADARRLTAVHAVPLDTSQLEALIARALGIAVPVVPAREEKPEEPEPVPDAPDALEVPEVKLPELEVEL